MKKTILITGTSTGFGHAAVEKLCLAGHRVFASMRDPENKNRAHADKLRATCAEIIELDVTSTKSVDQAVALVISMAGRIDVLVNNAGVAAVGISEAFTTEQAAALFDVNLFGLHRVTRAVLPTMRDQGDGLIINIGSIFGRVTFPFFGFYGASKFAVEALTDSYRYELSQFGVDVVLVQPSAYPTQMYASAGQPTDAKRLTEYGAVGDIPSAMSEQFGTMLSGKNAPNPQEVANTIADLVTTAKGRRPARTVVGQSFGADSLNEATTPVQSGVIKALGLDHLETLKTV